MLITFRFWEADELYNLKMVSSRQIKQIWIMINLDSRELESRRNGARYELRYDNMSALSPQNHESCEMHLLLNCEIKYFWKLSYKRYWETIVTEGPFKQAVNYYALIRSGLNGERILIGQKRILISLLKYTIVEISYLGPHAILLWTQSYLCWKV